MSSYPFRSGVDYNVCAVFDGFNEVPSCAEGVVYDEWDVVVVRYFCEFGEGCDVVFRVADRFDVDRFRLFVNRCCE